MEEQIQALMDQVAALQATVSDLATTLAAEVQRIDDELDVLYGGDGEDAEAGAGDEEE